MLELIAKQEINKVVPFITWEVIWEIKGYIIRKLLNQQKLRGYLERVYEVYQIASEEGLKYSPIGHRILNSLLFGEELAEEVKGSPDWHDLCYCYPIEDLLRETKSIGEVLKDLLEDLRGEIRRELLLELEVLDQELLKIFK